MAFDDSHYPVKESVMWLNRILDTAWYNHPVTLSNMTVDKVQPIFDANCPPPLVCVIVLEV